ncbi:DUF6210 family protein [Allostreptomyces psammosilenae]|uniref:Uncharacterized protein n=1 Tax=Allostreptomyces psammosilenae TaxID=1892865 RepID=A0A852ZPY8_9ACTN|nr:DUF6210 family protein [Allostreptomyces psammosilenae]NYI03557.1 hypothetical protein [Allostreptomyces psammosilenae]
MGTTRFVFLDPDGMAGGWLYVVVRAPTGVVYQQQYGGTACRQGEVEGFLVPVFGPDALEALHALFVEEFRGAGTPNHSWPEPERARLRGAVAGITYWASDGHTEEPHPLRLDESRILDVDEAWVPVVTPDGPGVLLWFNSD